MTNQSENKTDSATLDGAAWKSVKCAGNATIDNAAVALDALAVAMRGWCEARRELAEAEEDAMECCESICAEVESAADRLRGEADKRRADADAHTAAVQAKCCEVAKLHPSLAGNVVPLMQYATGEAAIASPVTYIHGNVREYVPEVTDANKDALAAFQPVRRTSPDTSALEVPAALPGAFSRMAEARKKYGDACRVLTDTMAMFRDSQADLADETATEAESIKKAFAIQRDRDSKTLC